MTRKKEADDPRPDGLGGEENVRERELVSVRKGKAAVDREQIVEVRGAAPPVPQDKERAFDGDAFELAAVTPAFVAPQDAVL